MRDRTIATRRRRRAGQLSDEYIQVLGGPDGKHCRVFEDLFLAGFRALRQHVDELAGLMEVMQQRTRARDRTGACAHPGPSSETGGVAAAPGVVVSLPGSTMACFRHGPAAVAAFRDRFQPTLPDDRLEDFVDSLIVAAADNVSTSLYDNYQYYANGIL